MMQPSVPCPKCGRLLSPAGEVFVEGEDQPRRVFQCDHCEITGPLGPMALTFTLTPDGRLDPEP